MIIARRPVRVVSFAAAFLLVAGLAAAQETRETMYRQYTEGLLARTAYTADAGGGLRVELWDLLVGPGKATRPFKLPGAAVLEIRSGQATVAIGGKEQRVTIGTPLSADEDSEIVLVNANADIPLSIRAIVITAR